MPITAITGTPGAGKTLRALQRVLTEVGVKDQSSVEAIRAGLKTANRHVVVCGVEGLQPGLFDTMDDPNNWQDLPDGSLVLVDEAWKWWGSHISGARTDQRVLDLAVHRHRGFDFVLTCQQPSQLQPHVRGLIGEHLHVTRKFGTSTTVCYEWPSVQDSPNGVAAKNQAIEKVWTHPKPIYDLYQSATQHTIKRKLPIRMLLVPVIGLLALVAAGGAVYAVSNIGKKGAKDGATAAGGEDAPAAATSPAAKSTPLTPTEYAKRFLPRFATMPQSAPAYDDLEVAARPEVYCIASEPGLDANGEWQPATHTCLTEQGTRYELDAGEARTVARYGTPYNPYKAPEADGSRPTPYGGGTPVPGAGGTRASAPQAVAMGAAQIGAYGDLGVSAEPRSAPR